MMNNRITKSILFALNSDHDGVAYSAVYGGETLLNRALIAMSKAGVQWVSIICPEGCRQRIEAMITTVRPRLALAYTVVELRVGEALSEKVARLTESWDEPFFLFACDKIIHPTFFMQAMKAIPSPGPVLLAYKDVWVQNGQVVFADAFPERFEVIFADISGFTKIPVQKHLAEQPSFVLDPLPRVDGAREAQIDLISTEVAICRPADVQKITYDSFAEMVQQGTENHSLAVGFVEQAWWLKVTGAENPQHLSAFFWKIAFKEISGEFSKLVNSKLSKPLTFLFVRLGFSPNAISILELVLFFASSAFLLIDRYWALLVFAIVWQLAAGVLDRCDGEVARIRSYESEAGARFDMLIDDLRFGIPFVCLTIACYRESHYDSLYLFVAVASFLWYTAAVIAHNRFLRRVGYVSIQTMGVDFLKTQEGTGWLKVFRKIQPFTKGDIRTFYIASLALLGYKPFLFWLLVVYAWPLGGSYFFTIKKFRLPSQAVQLPA